MQLVQAIAGANADWTITVAVTVGVKTTKAIGTRCKYDTKIYKSAVQRWGIERCILEYYTVHWLDTGSD